MPLTISIDASTLCIVVDGGVSKVLGTAFCFIKPSWVVTAKHVIFQDDVLRENILVSAHKRPQVKTKLVFAHPQVDLAVLELIQPFCERPLFPAHHALTGSSGFICAGYSPSQSMAKNAVAMFINEVPSFDIEVRERDQLQEELVVFDAPFSEGGHSGGPIFGAGGGVVGVIIQNFWAGEQLKARGTSLAPLLSHLHFREGG